MSYRLVGCAETPQQIADLLNKRRVELMLTQTDVDNIIGMASGYASKIFASQYNKSLGAISLPIFLSALGMRLALIADDRPEALPPITRRVVSERAKNPRPTHILLPRGSRAEQAARRYEKARADTSTVAGL